MGDERESVCVCVVRVDPTLYLIIACAHSVYLNLNRLSSVPRELACLRNVLTLHLTHNQLKEFPSSCVFEMPRLEGWVVVVVVVGMSFDKGIFFSSSSSSFLPKFVSWIEPNK